MRHFCPHARIALETAESGALGARVVFRNFQGGTNMRRKALAIVMLLGLLAAACGGGSDSGGSAGGQAAGQPDLNAEVRIAASEDTWPGGGTGAKS